MRSKFSPSINIIRDQEKDFNYIPTPNAERVIDQLNKNVLAGLKSFYLVGSFGTGKSAFLLAFEKQLASSVKPIFKTNISFNGKTKFESFNLVGDYRSLEDNLREKLRINSKKDVIDELNTYYNKIDSSQKGLIIAIDEFGKFLEYASHHNPEKELYLIQKLAEFSNDHKKNILFITTLHQGFEFYRSKLDEKIKNEWDKAKGRLKEITFNEPVEQLLHLAAKYINGKINNKESKNFHTLYNSILDSRVYPLHNALNEDLAQKIFPLDLLSAGTLTKSLQRYGQNERSLFTFLEANNYSNFITRKSSYFNLPSVYDYLIENFYSLLSSKYNPDFLKWSVIRNTLDRCEILFEKYSGPKEQLVKTIGLLNIFSPSGAHINKKFLNTYGKIALGISNVSSDLKELENKKLIRYQEYSDSFVLFEGTDIDIDLALIDAENYINKDFDLVSKLKEYFSFPYFPARTIYIEKGTPRFFEFVLSEQPVDLRPSGEVDGSINLLFNETTDLKKVKLFSKDNKEATLYAIFNNTDKIRLTINEIDKVNYVIENTVEDRVVQRELKNLKDSLITELNELVIDSLFENSGNISWIFDGEIQKIKTRSDFNRFLSKIIDKFYPKTPNLNNELINREKLSSQISTARKTLLNKLLYDADKENLGFSSNNYPPEKTIYLSLIQSTGIHRLENQEYILGAPKEKSFKPLWIVCEEFFESAKHSKKSLLELIEILQNKPFKLKRGFLDFWLPIYLIIKKDDYALFSEDYYIPQLSEDLFDLIIRYPRDYFIKAFDIQGIRFDLFNRYRSIINKSKEEKVTNKTFIETIKPFLTLYRSLPEYSKRTNRLSQEALSLREAIANAKDPEKTFFEDFPTALGYTTLKLYKSDKYLEGYVNQLQDCIRELRTAFEELVSRIEKNLLQVLGIDEKNFPTYKKYLMDRYSSIKTYLMLPHQKTLYQRINSGLDDRKSWLSSIVQGLIGKSLESISDDEEEIIHEKFTDLIHEFDSLSEFANLEIDIDRENAYKVEITSVNYGLQSAIIRLTKDQINEAKKIEREIKTRLGKDKKLNQIALLNILKNELNDSSKDDK